MLIRESSTADFTQMQALQIECIRGLVGEYPAGTYTDEDMQEWIRRIRSTEPRYRDTFNLVAVDRMDSIAAFISWHTRYTTKIESLYVAQEYRNRRLGSALLRAVEQAATIQTIELWATLNAQPFYEKQGYTFVGYPHDALFRMARMRKQL
ncbi:MAG TPA: GNAT family N-acetyltransferase [Candidatus Saccharimonadales bacterium]|nr:GNAT family N-acetyltransferase [Candidatus Saccharimonadales bacterium]